MLYVRVPIHTHDRGSRTHLRMCTIEILQGRALKEKNSVYVAAFRAVSGTARVKIAFMHCHDHIFLVTLGKHIAGEH